MVQEIVRTPGCSIAAHYASSDIPVWSEPDWSKNDLLDLTRRAYALLNTIDVDTTVTAFESSSIRAKFSNDEIGVLLYLEAAIDDLKSECEYNTELRREFVAALPSWTLEERAWPLRLFDDAIMTMTPRIKSYSERPLMQSDLPIYEASFHPESPDQFVPKNPMHLSP